ncbi:MAG: bacteriocin immunity protein [Pelagimonas sp.]|uniref:bacteriocin immunity protein n=1 Tax=Pelagimonas sp. TaxID=2073170 RepID=UPI003D6A0497
MIEALRKYQLNQFTKSEFLKFIDDISNDRAKTEEENEAWGRHFDQIVKPHPQKNGLFFWPEEGADDTPKGIVAELERYCRENGIPGFKDSDFLGRG